MRRGPQLWGQDIAKPTDGILAMRNDEDSFWQSRMTKAGARAELPNLVSLHTLARGIRKAYATAQTPTNAERHAARLERYLAHAEKYRPGESAADLVEHFPGIAARALTPGGSFVTGVDRSAVADSGQAGRGMDSQHGSGCTEPRCRYAETEAAKISLGLGPIATHLANGGTIYGADDRFTKSS